MRRAAGLWGSARPWGRSARAGRRGAARLGAAPAPLRPALPCPARCPGTRRGTPRCEAPPARSNGASASHRAAPLPLSGPALASFFTSAISSSVSGRPTALEAGPETSIAKPLRTHRCGNRPRHHFRPRAPPRPARKARSRPAHGRTRSEAPCRAGAAVAAPGIGVVVLRCSARGVTRIVKGGKRL